MWRIFFLFSLFARALSAPPGCIQLCSSQNLQSYPNLNCCGMPMAASLSDDRNHTSHNDFETPDGALVHKKDGTFVHGNTRGQFNEMSYFKETGGGINHNFGSGFENTIGSLQQPAFNPIRYQKIEDFGTSQNSFEAMFQSKYSGMMQSLQESHNHLQELKQRGQLQTQECQEPCVPIYQQISEAQRQWASQKQQMEQVREQLWSQFQQQQHQHQQVSYPTQYVQIAQPNQIVESVQTVHQQPIKKEWRQEWSHSQKTEVRPQITSTVTYPVRYTVYPSGVSSTSHQGIYRENKISGSGIQSQVGYDQEGQGSQGYQNQRPQGYETQTHGSQSYGTETQGSPIYGTQTHEAQGYESRTQGSQITGTQSHGSRGYGTQIQGSQIQGSQTHESQITGAQIHGSRGYGSQAYANQVQGSTGYRTSSTHSGMSQHAGVGFGSTSGGLLTETIAMGPTPDCNEESHYQQSAYSQRRYKRHSLDRKHHRHHGVEQEVLDVVDPLPAQLTTQGFPEQSDQRVDFGEPAKIQKVSQQEIEALGQQVEDSQHGKLETLDLDQGRVNLHKEIDQLAQHIEDTTQWIKDFIGQNEKEHHGDDYSQKIRSFDESTPQQTSHIESLSQQNQGFDDFSQHSGKIEFGQQQQHPSQIENFSQQNQGFDDFSQHSGKIEFGQQQQHPSQIENFSQQNQGFDDFSQHSGKIEFGQQQQHPSQIENFSQQNQGFDDFSQHSGKIEFGQQQQHPSQIENFSQQNQGFDDFSQHSGKIEFGQQQQHPSQDFTQQQSHGFDEFSPNSKIENLSQKTQEFEDLTQQSQTVSDFSQHPRGFDQHTVGNLKLDQPAQDFHDFNQFTTPVLAPDSKQLGNQRFEGYNQMSNLPLKPAPKPTSRPKNRKMTQLSQGKNSNFDNIFNANKTIENSREVQVDSGDEIGRQSPFENLRHTGRGDISAENIESPTDRALTPHEVSDAQEGYQKSSEVKYHEKDFGQQVQKPSDYFQHVPQQDISQDEQRQSRDFFQQVKREDFSEQTQKHYEGFSQQVEKSFEESSHKEQKSHEDFSQQVQNPFEEFSQQVQKSHEGFSQQVQKPFEEFSQQMQKSHDGFSQQVQKPFEDFSQQVQKPYKDFPQQHENPHKDFSQISDLNNKDITQLPQKPIGGLTRQSHQAQDKFIGHTSEVSQQSQELPFGNQWHRFHNPGDLTNEDLQVNKFPDQIQQTPLRQQYHEKEQTQQVEQIPKKQEKDQQNFDQQKTKEHVETWEQKMTREVEVVPGKAGKLEFGQSVQNHGSNSQLRKEPTTEINLQSRILEAYGGRGPYDPMHGDDIFNGARPNPSATLPPFIDGDPWDIREKPITPPVIQDETVMPLDTTWVFPDTIPHYPPTPAPKPGFWDRFSRRFTTAVDKAKEKARDIFG